ncbi:MAG: sulfatase [Acidobacteriota bacterium]
MNRAAARPSILLITIDTLRADHLSTYGYGLPTSPALSGLAERGTLFENAFSAASCTAPSHTSLMTGVMPSFHTVGAFNSKFPLEPEAATLAEQLAAAGYETAAVVSNPVLGPHLGLDQGFEVYDSDLRGREQNRDQPEQRVEAALEKARALLASPAFSGERPYFLWLHLQDPHGPYLPAAEAPTLIEAAAKRDMGEDQTVLPVGTDQSGYRAIPKYQVLPNLEGRVAAYVHRYDREIAHLDRQLGRFLEELEATGRLDNTLLAVTADHGEAFGEDGFYFAHGHSVGLDQVRVPLLLVGPGVPAGGRVSAPVSNLGWYATVLNIVGLGGDSAYPSLLESIAGSEGPVFVESLGQVGVALQGRFLRRDRVPAEDDAFWQAPNPTTGGFWKPLGRQLVSLPFLTGRDADLDDLLDGYLRRARVGMRQAADRRRGEIAHDDEDLRRLRALGYVN